MPKKNAHKLGVATRKRREFNEEFKLEAVQMTIDGLPPSVVAERLGIGNSQLITRWRKKFAQAGGAAATSLDTRVKRLEETLRQTERERDILKKALAIFSRGP
jgi:transposase